MEFGKRHDTIQIQLGTRQLVTDLLYGLVVYVEDLLRTCYWETGVVDNGFWPLGSLADALFLCGS